MTYDNSVLRVMQTMDLVECLAKALVSKVDIDLPECITHALVFDAPDKAVEFAVPYTYLEGVCEGDSVCRMKSSQCFIGDENGIAGVCEHKQQYPYKVIELRAKQTKSKVKEN